MIRPRRSSAEVERLQMGLLTIAERARRVAAHSPPFVVAWHVDLEVRHVLAGHGGGSGWDCDRCWAGRGKNLTA